MKRLLFLCFLLMPLPALAGDALVTSEVSVDVTGKDAVDARMQAMAKGEVEALSELLSKLTPPSQAQEIMASLEARKISTMVAGVEVLDERITANRYRARLIVSFDADEISALVGKVVAPGSPAIGTAATGSFLILTPYEEDGQRLLWEKDNPWAARWRQSSLETTTGDIITPYGDAADTGVVSAQSVQSATYAVLSPLTIRYGVTDVVVLDARLTRTPDISLAVTMRRVSRTRNEINLLTYRGDPQETRDILFARAASDIVTKLHQKKSKDTESQRNVRGGERGKIMVLASIGTLRAWTDIRARLTSMPMVERIELVAMSPQQVDMVLHYRGDTGSLATALEAQKLRLNQSNPSYWVISRD